MAQQPTFSNLPYARAQEQRDSDRRQERGRALGSIGGHLSSLASRGADVLGKLDERKEQSIRYSQAKDTRRALVFALDKIHGKKPDAFAKIGMTDPAKVIPPPPKGGSKEEMQKYLETMNGAVGTILSAGVRSGALTTEEIGELTGIAPNSPEIMKLLQGAAERRAPAEQKRQTQQAQGAAAEQALGAQFQEQPPSPQLRGALGGPSGETFAGQPFGGPMRGGPSMVTQGAAQTRPEAQQRVGQALGGIGAPPQDIQQQQRIAGQGLPETPPSPDDALMRDVETKGGMTKVLGANTYISGKKEQLGEVEAKAKGVQKILDKVLKDPQILSDPKKRQKLVAEAKPYGLWDDETGLASKEMMNEIITDAEEHAESLKGDVAGAEEDKKQLVQGKPKTATPKTATPMSPQAAEAKLNNEVNKRLRMMFPNDVEEIRDPYTKAVTSYRVVPNSQASKMISSPDKYAQFAQQYFPQLSKTAQVRAGSRGLGDPNPDPEGLF